ncbi:hypothetical protein PCE1_000894 [Barthelona sp. PCE]
MEQVQDIDICALLRSAYEDGSAIQFDRAASTVSFDSKGVSHTFPFNTQTNILHRRDNSRVLLISLAIAYNVCVEEGSYRSYILEYQKRDLPSENRLMNLNFRAFLQYLKTGVVSAHIKPKMGIIVPISEVDYHPWAQIPFEELFVEHDMEFPELTLFDTNDQGMVGIDAEAEQEAEGQAVMGLSKKEKINFNFNTVMLNDSMESIEDLNEQEEFMDNMVRYTNLGLIEPNFTVLQSKLLSQQQDSISDALSVFRSKYSELNSFLKQKRVRNEKKQKKKFRPIILVPSSGRSGRLSITLDNVKSFLGNGMYQNLSVEIPEKSIEKILPSSFIKTKDKFYFFDNYDSVKRTIDQLNARNQQQIQKNQNNLHRVKKEEALLSGIIIDGTNSLVSTLIPDMYPDYQSLFASIPTFYFCWKGNDVPSFVKNYNIQVIDFNPNRSHDHLRQINNFWNVVHEFVQQSK